MSLEQGGKTLGINNWKSNQGGFMDSECVLVFSNGRSIRYVLETPAG